MRALFRRRGGTLALACCVAFGGSFLASDAWAKKKGGVSKRALKKAKKRAAKFDKKGRQAYGEELWDDAIASFQLAYDTFPRAKYLFNIARCHENRGDLVEALEYVDRFLAEEKDEEQREVGQDTRAVMDKKLRAAWGELVIGSEPDGATVRLRSAGTIHEGKTPYRRWVEPGDWKVTVDKEGFEAVEEILTVAAGKQAELKPTLVDPKAEAERQAKKEAAAREAEEARERAEETARRLAEHERLVAEAAARDRRNLLILAGGGTLLLAGGVFAGLAVAKNGEIEDLESKGAFPSEFEEAQDAAEVRALAANVLLGVGIATAATAAALMLVADDVPAVPAEEDDDGDLALRPTLVLGGLGVVLEVSHD